jgi:type I restriction enzyme R subunit
MAQPVGTESQFEQTTIDRLKLLGYQYQYGGECNRPLNQVVLKDTLKAQLQKRYRHLPEKSLDELVSRACNPNGVTTLQRNEAFHHMLTRGLEHRYQTPDGNERFEHLYLVDWDNPDSPYNDFRVVNQFSIRGKNDRRPDIIVFVNGLPLVVFELKNPYDENVTVDGAYNQIQHYSVDIPDLFQFNAAVVISDGVTTQHGMWSANQEWYAPWKSIDGRTVEKNTSGSMKTLIEGLFPKERLLSYIKHFIVFETVNDNITKKGAKYHQFFGVRFAVQAAIRATQPEGDRRIGVVWHTQGSGKSLSMAFFVGMLRDDVRMANPTFVIQVDRTDLDSQLYEQFVAVKSLVRNLKHAGSVEQLRDHLQTEGGEVIFTTIEKFRLQGQAEHKEIEHPVLSPDRNIIVIADEAHRTQYGLLDGFAYHLRKALPNASFIGFTGTPIELTQADTQAVFGDVIHTYDIRQAEEDKATVKIVYEPRLVKLHLLNQQIDEELDEITEGEEMDDAQRRKSKWAALAAVAGSKDRVGVLAHDLLTHYLERTESNIGKAMVVCMSRQNCVTLYNELIQLADCPEVKIIMTGDITKDPKAWNEAGHITTKPQREALKARFKDPDDPLKIVIVRDMWLTGTDIPCLHTLYIDKPMQGHTLMQAIARVNRVFKDKAGGLLVDYIGIGDKLKEATRKYTQAGGEGEPAPSIDTEAKTTFKQCLLEIRAIMPAEKDLSNWRTLSYIEFEDLATLCFAHLTTTDEIRNEYFTAEKRLMSAYSLVKHLADCRTDADEVVFYQALRKQLRKTLPKQEQEKDRDRAIQDLRDKSIESTGVVDIFKLAGIENPDLSILDDAFLEEFKNHQTENLRVKLLERLLKDEIYFRQRKNLTKYKSFREMLEATILNYHNRAITAAEVVRVMIQIRKEMEEEDRRESELGLSAEELAFYDAVAENFGALYDQDFLCDLIREIVKAVKSNLQVDWTKPHRDDVILIPG